MQENKLNTYIEDENEARVGAETENKIRDLSKGIEVTNEEKDALNSIAEKHAEKSIQKYENIDKKEKFIQNILDEGLELDLLHMQNSQKAEINPNFDVFQKVYNQLLENSYFSSSKRILEFASKYKLEPTPDNKSLQSAYEKVIRQQDFKEIKEIEDLARQHNISLEMNNNISSVLQEIYCDSSWRNNEISKIEQFANEKGIKLEITQNILQKFYDDTLILWQIQKIEQFANEKGIKLEVITKDKLQKMYDKVQSIDDKQKIEQFANEKGIKLEITQDVLQKMYDKVQSIDDKQKIEQFANEKGIKLEITQDVLQKMYEYSWTNCYRLDDKQKIEQFANEKGIKLEITQDVLQKMYEYSWTHYYKLEEIEKIEQFANEKGIKLEITQDKLQKVFDEEISDKSSIFGLFDLVPKIEKVAEKFMLDIEVKKEVLQKGFERFCMAFGEEGALNSGDIKIAEEIAKTNGIKLDNVKEFIERAYIGIIHNVKMGHVDSRRKELSDMLREVSSKLTYEDVVKINYLEYLGTPESQILDIEKVVTINDVPIDVRFYGKKSVEFNGEYSGDYKTVIGTKGKFVMGMTNDNNLKFVFDGTFGEHTDIATKYNLKVIGGGWIEIDEENKKVFVFKSSEKFGYEARSISKQIIADIFPEYEIQVKP